MADPVYLVLRHEDVVYGGFMGNFISPFLSVTSCSLENSPVQRPGTRFAIEAASSLQPFIS